jgi:2-polyprenyl-3-methyl-5-hydroxy-6-metoxy-1,4-benzoquinol methylase
VSTSQGMFVAREACPACGSDELQTLYRCGFTEEPLGSFLADYYRQPIPAGIYQLDECLGCTLIFQRFVGSDAFLAELYSNWLVQDMDDEYRAELSHFSVSRDGAELATLAAHLGKRRLKVLDYGAGWGLWPIIATRLGHEAYAVELAPEKADWARRNGVNVITDDEIHRHSFDVINLEQTLEHLTEPRKLLNLLAPSLDGVLKIAVPNPSPNIIADLSRGDTSSITALLPFEHVNGFNPRSLSLLAHSIGLTEVRPSLRHRYSFLRPSGLRRPRRLAKELLRPLVAFNQPHNLYRWFTREL